MDKLEATRILNKLSDHFGVQYTLKWHGRTKRAYCRPISKEIHVGPFCWRGINTLLHEYAHLISWYLKDGYKKPYDHHGIHFRKAILDVATFWYGDASKYQWETEYAGVRAYGKLESKRQAVTSNIKEDNMFTVEDGIPVPEKTRKGKVEKYGFSKLSVGQSFFVPSGENDNITKTVTHAAYSAEKRLSSSPNSGDYIGPYRFTVRSAEKDGVNGCRVWRTE